MRELRLSIPDDLFAALSRQAKVDGFESPEQYVADFISHGHVLSIDNLDHMFTPKVIAHLDEISERIRAGEKTFTIDQCKAELAKRKAEWLGNHQN